MRGRANKERNDCAEMGVEGRVITRVGVEVGGVVVGWQISKDGFRRVAKIEKLRTGMS